LNFRYIIPALVAATCTLNAQAAGGRWFDVEILVFKRNLDVQKNTEQLDENDVYIKQRERLEVIKAKAVTNCAIDQPCIHQKNPVQLTDNEMVQGGHRIKRLNSLRLKTQLSRLNNHQLFTPLLHTTWRMPIQSKQNALPIHLFAGQNYALDLYKDEIAKNASTTAISTQQVTQVDNQIVSESDHQLDALTALEKHDKIQDLYEIDGNFLIYVGHYLHIDSQLIVRTKTQKPVSSTKPVSQNIKPVSLDEADDAVQVVDLKPIEQTKVKTETVITETLFDQNKRLKSGEIHYFDHPLFGIIVQVRR